MMELKSANHSTNPMFKKASLWLLHGRTFQRFDKTGVGIIELPELGTAMAEFLQNAWKFEGVLW